MGGYSVEFQVDEVLKTLYVIHFLLLYQLLDLLVERGVSEAVYSDFGIDPENVVGGEDRLFEDVPLGVLVWPLDGESHLLIESLDKEPRTDVSL